MQDFGERIHEGFTRLWERFMRIHRDLQGIHETLGEDLWGFMIHETLAFMRICGNLQDFGRGLARIHETLGEDSSQDLGEDSWEICEHS